MSQSKYKFVLLPYRLKGNLEFSLNWKAKEGERVSEHQLIAIVGNRGDHPDIEIRSPAQGILKGPLIDENSAKEMLRNLSSHNDISVARIEICPHSIIYEGLCTACGADTTM